MVGERAASARRGVTALLVGVAVAVPAGCGMLEEQRFERSAASMEQVARTVREDDDPTRRPREIGSLAFEDVYRDGDRVYFMLGEVIEGVDPYGYAYSPNERPVDHDDSDSVDSAFEHIRGPWYHWSDTY
ncbi:hypothetical protein ACWGH8_28160 [Nonomuraea muscovyensis]